jgi:hypothetical protein
MKARAFGRVRTVRCLIFDGCDNVRAVLDKPNHIRAEFGVTFYVPGRWDINVKKKIFSNLINEIWKKKKSVTCY